MLNRSYPYKTHTRACLPNYWNARPLDLFYMAHNMNFIGFALKMYVFFNWHNPHIAPAPHWYSFGLTVKNPASRGAKNTGNIIMNTLMNSCIDFPAFWTLGFGLLFDISNGGRIRTPDITVRHNSIPREPPTPAFLIFQTVFWAAVTNIMAGAIAKRTQFVSYGMCCSFVKGKESFYLYKWVAMLLISIYHEIMIYLKQTTIPSAFFPSDGTGAGSRPIPDKTPGHDWAGANDNIRAPRHKQNKPAEHEASEH